MARVLLLLLLALPAWALALPQHHAAEIRDSAERWLPQWDWRWWQAQIYQESRMDPLATSPAGAMGLAQIMPNTFRQHWRTVSRAIGANLVDPYSVQASLQVGAYYMRWCRAQWNAERPEPDRRRLAQACYNAGLGHLLTAQHLCGDARHWPEISQCLPAVTGEHSRETIGYVSRIEHWYRVYRLESAP